MKFFKSAKLAAGLLVCSILFSITGCSNASVSGTQSSISPSDVSISQESSSTIVEEDSSRFCVVIDPGHQAKANATLEPIGPGASEEKAKVSAGTAGHVSGLPEYELNLQVGLALQAELEARNFRVVMTRSDHDVDLSNAQRARIATEANAEAFIRIHANGSEDPSVQGAMTICMTPKSPYCAPLYPASRLLSDCVLNGMAAATGRSPRSVWETDTMSGINWSTVPVTIVEMGYMTNQEDDALMATAAYQSKLVTGIADGIEDYFRLSYPSGSTEATLDHDLQALVTQALSGRSDVWDVWCENLTTGSIAPVRITASSDDKIVAASLIKLFVMGAALQAVDRGTLDYEAIRSDVANMIQISDNPSTNRLIRLLGNGDAVAGMQAVNAFALQFGCEDTQLNRLMLENNGAENYTSAKDCAEILRLIYHGRCVSSEWSKEMLSILTGQQKNTRLPASLPQGTVVAHKTGTLTHVSCGDVGITFSPERDYIICVINNKSKNDSKTEALIASLSRTVYDYYNP